MAADPIQHKHLMEEPVQCEICGKRLSSLDTLRSHSAIHREKQFKCEYCGRRFSRKHHLADHTSAKVCKKSPPAIRVDLVRLSHSEKARQRIDKMVTEVKARQRACHKTKPYYDIKDNRLIGRCMESGEKTKSADESSRNSLQLSLEETPFCTVTLNVSPSNAYHDPESAVQNAALATESTKRKVEYRMKALTKLWEEDDVMAGGKYI